MEIFRKLKKIIKAEILLWLVLGLLLLLVSFKNYTAPNNIVVNADSETIETATQENSKTSQDFKKYWYAGEAEVSSYKLEQARYGEIREGTAVLVFVTEDFLPDAQVKANYKNAKNIPVLKLNAIKKFNTGLYPYSIMQSTFYPVSNNKHALKVSSSMQEWCGHVYAQLNNREQFEIMSHSYFDGEADKNFKVDKAILENELWAKLRIDPKSLPIGDLKMIPSFEYTRFKHKTIKAYNASATLKGNTYTINYPDLNRTLSITLLNIDQMANRAIPRIANTEEKTTARSLNCAPKIKASIITATKKSVTVTYLRISLILASLISFFLATLVIVKCVINLIINKERRIIPDTISSLR